MTLTKTIHQIKISITRAERSGGHLHQFSQTSLRPNRSEMEPTSFPSPGLPAARLFVLTSAQEQISDLLEGSADSSDAAWDGLLKILKGRRVAVLQLHRGHAAVLGGGSLPAWRGQCSLHLQRQ